MHRHTTPTGAYTSSPGTRLTRRRLVADATAFALAGGLLPRTAHGTHATAQTGKRAISLTATPSAVAWDEPFDLNLDGFRPQETVKVASLLRMGGQFWGAEARFQTDRRGRVDVSRSTPIRGDFDVADPMAFIWAATPGSVVANTVIDDPNLTLAVYYDGIELARVSITRSHVPLDYEPEFIYTPDRVGYFYPPVKQAGDPAPAILVLGGEDGGVPSFNLAAALLAARGFAVLDLGYFRVGSLPATLERIPLEYFGEAISWMRAQPSISADRIGVLGYSRGGELALLLGAYYPELSSVVSINGSGLVHAGMGRNYSHSMASAWTWQGEELPYWIEGFPPEKAFESTEIPVERTNGPVLIISGDADEFWLSTRLSHVAWDRLQGSRRPWNDQFLQYPGAGHAIGTPYVPMTPSTTSHIPGKQVGGTVQANQVASVSSWQAILQHFRTSLRVFGA